MPDKVKLSAFKMSHCLMLAGKLLHAILAKQAQASVIGFDNARRLHGLAHRHELYGFRRAAGALGGGSNALADSLDIFANTHAKKDKPPIRLARRGQARSGQ